MILLTTSVATLLCWAGQTPISDSTPQREPEKTLSLEEVRDLYRDAQALHARGVIEIKYDSAVIGKTKRDEPSELVTVARLKMRADWAAVGWGSIDFSGSFAASDEAVTTHYETIGTEQGVFEVDHDDQTFEGPIDADQLSDPLSPTFPFSVVLQGNATIPSKARPIGSHADHPTWVGWTWPSANGKTELWLEGEVPRLVSVSILRGKTVMQQVDLHLQEVELKAEVDQDDYVQTIPDGYESIDAGIVSLGGPEDALIARGAPAPNIEVVKLDGKTLQLTELRGQNVLLHFWSYDSEDSQETMPQLQSLWTEMQKRRSNVVILCVNSGDSKSVIEDWWTEQSFSLPVVRQRGNSASKIMGVRVHPTTYLIDPSGRIVYRAAGHNEAAIRKHLGI